MKKEKHEAIMEMLKGYYFDKAIDIGCGFGEITNHISGNCNNMLAIDKERRLNVTPNFKFVWLDIEEVKIIGKYDLVVFSDVIYYLKDPHKVLMNIYEIMHEYSKLLMSRHLGLRDKERKMLECFFAEIRKEEIFYDDARHWEISLWRKKC